jgi:ABC-type transport system substrate-binding protein
MPDDNEIQRRRFLEATGAATIAAGIAGCPGDGGDGEDGEDGGATPTSTEGDGEDGDTGAGGTDESEIVEGGTLNVGLTSSPSSFDPPYSSGVPSSTVQNFFYESLIATDEQGNPYPWLAESYELVDTQEVGPTDYEEYMTTVPVAVNEDGDPFLDTDAQVIIQHPDDALEEGNEVRILTPDEASDAVDDGTFGMQFQYNLHEGITFTNGEELTAQNVVDSYVRIRNSQISAQVFNTFLAGEVIDDYTVNLYAQEPDAEAERQIPQVVFPSDHIDVPGGELDPRQGTNPVGTGPWEFESFEAGSSFVVSRRDDYWMEEVGLDSKDWWDGPEDFPESPVIDKINMRFVSEGAQRAGALQENEIDVTYGLTAEAQNNFDDSEDYGVKSIETGGYLFMQYPVKVPPFDNKQVRQAMNYLVPRKQIVENISLGWARPAWIPLPELAYGSGTQDAEALEDELKPKNEYKPQQAQQLIEEADVETPIEVTIETNSDNQDRVRKCEAIVQSLNNAGGGNLFEAELETFEFGDLVGRILSPTYFEKGNIVVIGLSGTFNPGSFCNATHHSRNFAQCCNFQNIGFDELDQMMDDARFSQAVLGDPEERGRRYDEIWRKIVDLSANSYIDIDKTTAVHNTDVKGFSAYPFPEGMFSFALYAPYRNQITYLDRE